MRQVSVGSILRRLRGHALHVALEGIDGTGKSTALHAVADALREVGVTVSEVRYTAKAGPPGRLITWLYHSRPPGRVVAWLRRYRALQVIVYGANGRVNLLRRTRGTQILLSDRSVLSGYAHAGHVPRWLVTWTTPLHAPDLIIFLDLDPVEASRRLHDRGESDHEEDVASLHAFRARYEQLVVSPPRRLRRAQICVIDASNNRDILVKLILAPIHEAMRSFEC